ncbi:MAG: hypothetical protein ACI9E4_000709, partial [Pseudohongiellaceae bacterium]
MTGRLLAGCIYVKFLLPRRHRSADSKKRLSRKIKGVENQRGRSSLIKNWRYEKFLLKLEVSSHTARLNFQYCLVNLDIS